MQFQLPRRGPAPSPEWLSRIVSEKLALDLRCFDWLSPSAQIPSVVRFSDRYRHSATAVAPFRLVRVFCLVNEKERKMRMSVMLIVSLMFSTALFDQAVGDLAHPDGLEVGDRYRIAFVTDGTTDALQGNPLFYDQFVTGQANLPGSVTVALLTDWSAIVSTFGAPAREHTNTNPDVETGVPIFLVDGATRIAGDNQDLWDGLLENPLALDQFGLLAQGRVWTGTGPLGLTHVPLGVGSSTSGLAGDFSVGWIQNSVDSGTASNRIYGISGVLTVNAIPEPGVFTGLWILLIQWARPLRRRPRN